MAATVFSSGPSTAPVLQVQWWAVDARGAGLLCTRRAAVIAASVVAAHGERADLDVSRL